MTRPHALLFAGIVLLLGFSRLPADPITSDQMITSGDYVNSNWRSSDFKGTSSRDWDGTGKNFTFVWNTQAGDQIGRVGVTYGSKLLGCSIDQMPADSVMSAKAVITPTTDHWFYWSIYGWTNAPYTYWGNTPSGWNNEFYIIFHTDRTTKDFLTDKGVVGIGSVEVDGVTFDCFKTPREHQSQFFAVTRSKTWNASVNLKKIFAYWRTQGLGNESVVDLGWAVEGFIGSAGKLQLTDIHIPDLSVASVAAKPTANAP
jgi:hypothetical protein